MVNDLVHIYKTLKPLLQKYNPPFISHIDLPTKYDLYANKKVVIAGRERNEVWFAGLTIHRTFVGFYYMPIYAYPKLLKTLPTHLAKLLKGKSCFHIKQIDEILIEEITEVIDAGYLFYQKNGWV